MKSLLVKTLVASCLIGLVAVGFAQNENKKKGGKKKGGDPTAQLRTKVADAGLGDELTEKVTKVIDEHAPKLKEAQAKVDEVLTDEQKKARREAQQAGKAAGKKGKELQAEVAAALKLSDEQKKKMDESQKTLDAARADLNKAIAALLTDEQKEKLGIGGKKKGKKNA